MRFKVGVSEGSAPGTRDLIFPDPYTLDIRERTVNV